MSFFGLNTSLDLYIALGQRGEGMVARVVSLLGKGKTKQGRKWFQFKIALKKYAETKGDDCKQEYHLVKAWGDEAERCEKQLKRGCIIKFIGEFMKDQIIGPDSDTENIACPKCGEVIKRQKQYELGEWRLIQLLNVRYPENYKEEKQDE